MPLPSMNKAKAAYAASQPMLDALLLGEEKIHEQQLLLATASELVRTVHVHVPSAIGDDGLQKHHQYLDVIVKAWRGATEVYNDVFAALIAVTASDHTVGREAGENYDLFLRMAQSAHSARKVAYEYNLSGVPAPHFESLVARNGTVTSHKDETVTPAAFGTAHNGTKHQREENDSGLRARNPKVARMEVLSQITERGKFTAGSPKKKRRRERPKHAASNTVDKELKISKEDNTQKEDVEYEDINDEVNARLAAKTAERSQQKETAKAEKKRKRESADSLAMRSGADSKTAGLKSAEKPHKKKSRTAAEKEISVEIPPNPSPAAKRDKRRMSEKGDENASTAVSRKSKRVRA